MINPFAYGRVVDSSQYCTRPKVEKALKSMMEDPDRNARFILICNKPHKIIPEIHSRCTTYVFTALEKNAMKKIGLEILQDNGMDLTAVDQGELLETMDAHLQTAFPDLRKFINSLERGFIDGTLSPPSLDAEELELLVTMIVKIEEGDWRGIRDIIYTDLPADEVGNVFRFIDTNLHEIDKFNNSSLSAKGYLTLAHYAALHDTVAIPELNLTACMIKLCELGA